MKGIRAENDLMFENYVRVISEDERRNIVVGHPMIDRPAVDSNGSIYI